MLKRLWLVVCVAWMIATAILFDLASPSPSAEIYWALFGIAPILAGWIVVPVWRYVLLGELPACLDRFQRLL